MPTLRNLIDHETVRGYRTFELWEGDITDPGFPVDILAVSYDEEPENFLESSVVGALLARHGISVYDLMAAEQGDRLEFDLRPVLGVWLSRRLTGAPFQRILGVNLTDENLHISEALENVFASLALFEAKGIEVRTFALPLFGTGGLGYDPEYVLKVLLPLAKKSIEQSPALERVAFFGFKPRMVDMLDEAMNQILGRSRVTLPKKTMITGLCSDIVTAFQTSRHLVEDRHLPLITEFESVLRRDTIRSFEIGILGRRIAEMIVLDLLGGNGGNLLARNIDKLRENGIADWIISYFNVLRQLGNESAHETHAGKRIPSFVSEGDLAVGLSCLQRLWEFWVDWKSTAKQERTHNNNFADAAAH